MKRTSIRMCAVGLTVILCLAALLSGCGSKEVTLRVLSDAEYGSRENEQIDTLITQFKATHEGVNIVYERIPTDEAAREAMLEKTRTAVMAGKGPDVFLLTTSTEKDPGYEAGNGLLFKDVKQAICNGLFADVSEYYDADTELGKEAFVPAVMEAGVYNGGRYVLPLRFELPVCYVDKSQLTAEGFGLDIFDGGLLGLMNAITASGSQRMATDFLTYNIIRSNFFNFFPNLLDYDNQKVLITADELAEFMTSHQQMRTLQGNWPGYEWVGDLGSYFMDGWYWPDNVVSRIAGMSAAVYNASVSKAKDVDLSIVPLTAADGTLIADVTYYGAVGASCDEPELAYEFLRLFLSEDSQWENNVNGRYDVNPAIAGWPVRTVNAAQQIFNNQCRYYKGQDQSIYKPAMIKRIQFFEPNDDDFPDWHEIIDLARFSIPMEKIVAERVWYDLNTPIRQNSLPTDVDINALADDIIKQLEWHLYEG